MTAVQRKTASAVAQTRAPTFAELVAAEQASHEAHTAACAAYSKIEERVFAKQIPATDPMYIAAEAAEGLACTASMEAWANLIEAPAPDLRGALVQLRTLDRKGVLGLDEPDGPVRGEPYDTDEAIKRVVRNLLKHAPSPAPDADSPAELSSPQRTNWDAALAKWADARAQLDAHEAATGATWRAVAEAAPPEIVQHNLHYGLVVRWTTLGELDRDILLSDAEKDALRPLLAEHYALQKEHNNAPERDAEDSQTEALFDRVNDAEDELFALTPPTLRDLVLKQQVEAREADDDKLGYDDLGLVSYLLGGSLDKRNPVRLHMDLLRLAGVHHPMLDMEPFRPAVWIAAYEAAGGFVSAGWHDALLLFPGSELTDALQSALNATPWKYRAVQLQAENRREQGGDPVFDCHLETGDRDKRGGRPQGPPLPYRRVERITFTAHDGRAVPHVQSLHRQGDRLGQLATAQPGQVAA